jgi:hypothetical protein
MPSQDFSSHRRWYPLYHFVTLPLLMANLVFAWRHARMASTTYDWWQVALALTLIVFSVAARGMALRVQDRVIRLEMRLRLREVLPAALAARIAELTPRQMVGLRFAGDAELPKLVERCLAGELTGSDQIKKEIRDWQADWLRA